MSKSARISVAFMALFCLLLGLLLGWLAAHLLSLRMDAPTMAVFDNWRLACPAATAKSRACALTQDVVDAKSGAHVATLNLVHGPKGAVMVITVPYNVLIQPGLSLALGGDKARPYPYTTCNNVGCVAQLGVDDTMRAAFRQEPQAKLLFVNRNRQTVQINFIMRGFRRADDAARRFEGALWWLGYPV
jgi:invasion protein IalB